MAAEVICFASAKGGTGKTTTSASLAMILAALGKEVLLIDMDAATNGLTLFFLDKLIEKKESLSQEKKFGKGIFEATETALPIPFFIDASISFIPAAYEMKQTECPSDESIFENLVSRTIEANKELYNYIIIDTQAGTEVYTKGPLRNADRIVIVSEYDPISAEGVERFKRLFSDILQPEKTWVLFNKILPEFSRSLGEFLGIAKYLNPIPWDADVVRALARRKLAIDTEKGNAYTLAVMLMAHSLLGDKISREMNQWKKEKANNIREPARRELSEIQKQIESLEKSRIDIDYKLRNLTRKPKLIASVLTAYTMALIVYFSFREYFLTGSFEFNEYTRVLIVAVMMLPIIIMNSENIFGKIFEKRSKNLEEESRFITRKLEDLNNLRQKYDVLLNSDINDIIVKKI